MKKWILMGAIGFLGSGLITLSFAQELESYSEATQRLFTQYEVLKTQSLTLIETVKNLKEERRRLMEELEVLGKENQDLIPKVKELSEALDQARQSLGVLRQQHAAALARVEALEQAQLKTLAQEMQDLQKSLGNLKEEDLKR